MTPSAFLAGLSFLALNLVLNLLFCRHAADAWCKGSRLWAVIVIGLDLALTCWLASLGLAQWGR